MALSLGERRAWTLRLGGLAAIMMLAMFMLTTSERYLSPSSDSLRKLHSAEVVAGQHAADEALLARVAALEKKVQVLQRKSWQEHLDPQFHYRAKFMLGKATDPEDRMPIEPFYLGHMVNASESPRRVYIDLGMREFGSSFCYMLKSYPAHFTEFHAFECCNTDNSQSPVGEGGLPPLRPQQVKECLKENNPQGYTAKEVVAHAKLYHNFVGAKDDSSRQPPQVGLNGFLRSLRLRAHDFVVIKMDIEGGEYETIRNLVAEPSIAETVDEIMVEVHYAHPEMHWAYWDVNFPDHTLVEAHVLMQRARDAGIAVHPWP